jgi:IclR family transcriptional regulator, pca regulon regulatory protein
MNDDRKRERTLKPDEEKEGVNQRNSIQSMVRGLSIIELLAKSSQSLTLTEIAGQGGITKTSALRFLNTLNALGYVKRGEDKRYALSSKVLSLAYGFFNTSSLVKMAKPYLDELSTELNVTTNLAVLDDVHALFLYHNEVKRFMKFELGPGSKVPCYAGSLGKVLLSGLNEDELTKRISRIEFAQITPKTITSKEELRKEINKIRRKGYAISDRELSLDMYSMAVPLFDDRGEMIAAINVSMESSLKDSPDLNDKLNKLVEHGEVICRNLGYSGPYGISSEGQRPPVKRNRSRDSF